jgi:phosphate starvation-inducible PhoH-like protein
MKKSKTITGAGLVKLPPIKPLTENQARACSSEGHLVLNGYAGTGKTFLSCYLAYEAMFQGLYDRLIIIRSAVPTRDIGFLPGSEKEKVSVYEEPYKDITEELFERGDAYQILTTKGLVDFMTTSFIRGITRNNAIIVVDECQNMTFHELDSIITRAGKNCRIIFCGDFTQADLPKNGLRSFFKILSAMDDEFTFIEFGEEDIVRGPLVKKYIIAKNKIGVDEGNNQ